MADVTLPSTATVQSSASSATEDTATGRTHGHAIAQEADLESQLQEKELNQRVTLTESPQSPIAPATSPSYPDGGLIAWSQCLMGWLLMFSSWGLINCFGVFEAYFVTIDPPLSSKSSISWIGSLQSCLLLFCGAFGGRAMDANYARSMVITGSILVVLGMFFTSLSGQSQEKDGEVKLVYWQILLSHGVCEGLGMGLLFLPSIGIPASYFMKKRALATGIVTTGACLGGIVYPIVFEELLDKVGFRWSMRVLGFIALFTLGIACVLVRQRTDMPKRPGAPLLELGAFKEAQYTTLVIGMALSFMGCYIPYYYIETLAISAKVNLHGLEDFYLVVFINVGGIFGRVIPNYLADIFGPLPVHSTCVLIGGILIFVWPHIFSLAGLIIFALIYGFFSGAFISLVAASVSKCTKDMSRFGARLGMAVTCNGLGVLAGPPIAGAIIGAGGKYVNCSIFAGMIVLAAGASLGTTAILQRRNHKA